MTIHLNQARNVIRRSALHIGSTTFSDEKVDDAVKLSGKAFLRLTKASLTSTGVTLSKGTQNVDLTSSITGFSQSDYEFGEIDGYMVRLVPYQSILRDQINTRVGRPDRIAFRPDDSGMLNKQTDQEYTFNVTHYERMPSFVSGTGANPELPLPDNYAESIMWFGGRYYLLYGAPGHPDASTARDEFIRVIQEAQAQYGQIASGTKDLSIPLSQWGRSMRQGGDD